MPKKKRKPIWKRGVKSSGLGSAADRSESQRYDTLLKVIKGKPTMTLKTQNKTALEWLRKQAEEALGQRGTTPARGVELELLRLLNEIEVYQVELELQNQELNRSTKELEAARNDYFELYDSAPVAFVTLNSKGMIERVNKAAARLLKRSGTLQEESLFSRAVHPADQAAFFSYLNKLVTDKKQSSCEMRLQGKEDRPLWVHFFARSIVDIHKQFTGWRLAIIDVTEHKQQELAMQKAQVELERRAAQLARLSLELTMAEQRERRRLAEVMHDNLQQLLAGAKLNLGMVTAESTDQQSALEIGCSLIRESLEVSRTLSAELSPPVLFQQGLREALEWLARWMKKTHALDVAIHVDEEDYPVEEAIKVLMFQSVRELLFNVTKHAKVTCAQVAMSRQDARLKLVVSDAGTGFDPQQLWCDREIDKGFGLFSVRERLVLLEGTFEIESSPEGGTTVTLTAPMHTSAFTQADDRIAAAADVPPAHCPTRAPHQGSGKIQVMLVDDHLVMRTGFAPCFPCMRMSKSQAKLQTEKKRWTWRGKSFLTLF
jgi:PAS domain S-box-containing protein